MMITQLLGKVWEILCIQKNYKLFKLKKNICFSLHFSHGINRSDLPTEWLSKPVLGLLLYTGFWKPLYKYIP